MQPFYLVNNSRVELVASYQIKDKKEVAEGAKAKWTRKSNLPEVTKSWHDYQVAEISQFDIISLLMPSFSRSENLSETSSTKCFRHMSNPTVRRPVPQYHRLDLIAILIKDLILSCPG